MKMGSSSTNPLFKDQFLSFTKRILPWTLLPIALLHLYLYPLLPFSPSPKTQISHSISITTIISASSDSSLSVSTPSPPPSSAEKENVYEKPCDYSNGKWVHDKRGPLYNDTTCGTIKYGRNCITHGRPDSEYLHWRWKPIQCHIPRFNPQTFLQLIKNKHIAFVGDSLARNQLESLLCMLSTSSNPHSLYQNGEENKFGRWRFNSHNATVSLYWSPFLVQGVEKSSKNPNNELYLDRVDERWAKDMDQTDLIVISIGHWFLLPAVYHEGGSVLGCHYCPGLNHTEIGFYDVLRKALRTTLNSIIDRRGGKGKNGIGVIVTTFSPHHFEGDWDKAGACPKTRPYEEKEKELDGMDGEMRKIEIEEVQNARAKAKSNEVIGGFRFEALDVTKLALLRPDGHPGPYMNPFPFVNGVPKSVQNDCVHWCLPGPVDTWNEIFLEMIKKWEERPKSEE